MWLPVILRFFIFISLTYVGLIDLLLFLVCWSFDDAVFFFKSQQVAEDFFQQLHARVSQYGLCLNEVKTCIVDFRNSENNHFDFLGFTFYWGKTIRHKRLLSVKTQKKQLHKKLQEFDHWIKEVRSQMKISDIWGMAQSKLSGHYQYFGYWMNRPKLNHFYWEAIKSLFRWLNRRSQKRSYSWDGFAERLKQLPLPTPPTPSQLRQLGWSPYV